MDGSEEVDATNFRRTIGCLRYLTHTHPDLIYSSCLPSYLVKGADCRDYDEKEYPIVIKIDNKFAIARVKSPVFRGRSKHINECVEREQIQVEHISGEEQRVDILTKALPKIIFLEMRKKLGMEEIEEQGVGTSIGIKAGQALIRSTIDDPSQATLKAYPRRNRARKEEVICVIKDDSGSMAGANQGGGDGVLVPAREQNHVSLQCPKLTTTNYTPWAIMLETILKAQGIWDAIDPVTGATVDARKNYTTKAIIYQSLHEDILLQVARYEFAKDVWEAIRVRFLGADQTFPSNPNIPTTDPVGVS
ncbi:hypothetical protein E3N88_18268 [Mikania micrantha]|uniref:DUF4219 domain-containing protein n=1 Tax=Mikania micrantha TaxID=192012 RepID=A0A5N6NU58_9ASTR|nr:hypothetical protein E3N88_18268 [Mikania micrantha]